MPLSVDCCGMQEQARARHRQPPTSACEGSGKRVGAGEAGSQKTLSEFVEEV
jgi:hypothetical protein